MRDMTTKYEGKNGRTAVADDTEIIVWDKRGREIYRGGYPRGVTKNTALQFVNSVEPTAPAKTVTIPGALADFLDGTGFMSGNDDHDPESKLARTEIENGTTRRYGRGYRVIVQASPSTVQIITEYAHTLEYADETTPAERRAAAKWLASRYGK